MIRIIFSALLLLVAFLSLPATAFVSGTPVPTDSRIKTFVYHANDVYRVLTHYGYQMNIELGEEEEIETISVGDRSGWQITPDENRIFIRAMQDKSHTNMTVVTDQRTYQFDLYSSKPGENGWDELVYVIRFYYPDEKANQFAGISQPRAVPAAFPAPMAPAPMFPQMPAIPSMNPAMPPMTTMPPSLPAMPPVLPPAPSMSPMIPTPQMAAPVPLCVVPTLCAPVAPMMPSVQPPPMATPQAMAHPAMPVPSVNVMREPFGMVPPNHMSVATPPQLPHPRAPFVANQMSFSAQHLAKKYPQNSYQNSMLVPRMLPSLERALHSSRLPNMHGAQMGRMTTGLPLPSTVSGRYMDF